MLVPFVDQRGVPKRKRPTFQSSFWPLFDQLRFKTQTRHNHKKLLQEDLHSTTQKVLLILSKV